ncbi:MAG: MBL fold metallo-hydrolase [Promethearchaeota archaeon]
MKVKFYGGVNTIGGNCFLLESSDGETRVLLDFGMNFGKECGEGRYYEEFLRARSFNEAKDLLRLDLLPKIPGVYRDDLLNLPDAGDALEHVVDLDGYDEGVARDLWFTPGLESYEQYAGENGRGYVDAVFVSHVHLDHLKYVKFLAPEIPVYLSPVSRAVMEVAGETGAQSEERHVLEVKRRANSPVQKGPSAGAPRVTSQYSSVERRDLRLLAPGGEVTVGCFTVKGYEVDHSLPGALGFLVRDDSDGSTLAYTGDLRFHGYRGEASNAFQEAVAGVPGGIDALIVEGTHVGEDAFHSEDEVREELLEFTRATPGLVCVSFQWKNVFRYRTVLEVARSAGRTLVVSPKLAFLVNRLSRFPELGLEPLEGVSEVRVFFPRKQSGLYHDHDYSRKQLSFQLQFRDRAVYPWHIRGDPGRYLFQLTYWDLNNLVDLAPAGGFRDAGYVVSSISPFDEEMELSEERLSHWLEEFGLKQEGAEVTHIHVSGHASGPEIEAFIRAVGPGVVFPVHTENPGWFTGERLGVPVVNDLGRFDCFEVRPGGNFAKIPDFTPVRQ